MTNFLLKLFVYRQEDTDSAVRSAIGKLAGWVGISCNILLFAVKLLLGLQTGSVSVTADAMNNLSDASGSVVTLLGFRMADKPADEHHPFGHARAEYLSGLAVAVMILFIGFELGKSSLDKILYPQPLMMTRLSAVLLMGSIGVKLWLSCFYSRLGKMIGSASLAASASDSRNDCIATLGVLLAGAVESLLHIPVDGLFGMAIAVFILVSGWQLARDTVSPLLGENADPGLRQTLIRHIADHPKILGYHDLMVHDYGPGQRYASVHVEMDHREDPLECHAIIDEMEWECLRNHNVHLVIHYDPIITDDPELTRLQEKTAYLLSELDHRLKLHDFRMIQGKKHMNLIFHVPLPEDLRGQKKAIRSCIEEKLQIEDGKVYHVTITYDSTAFNL